MKTMKRGIAQVTDATVGYGIVAAIVVILLIPLSSWAQEMYRMYRAGEQANQVQRAVNRYIADQQSTIAANQQRVNGLHADRTDADNCRVSATGLFIHQCLYIDLQDSDLPANRQQVSHHDVYDRRDCVESESGPNVSRIHRRIRRIY